MLSIRKQKGFKMILNSVEHGELESFTLIHLNEIETELFLREVGLEPFTGFKTIEYRAGDSYDLLFKRFADEHRQNNKGFVKNASEFWYSKEGVGKWLLIREPDEHIIRLVPNRKNTRHNYLNRLNLTDDGVKQFCKDCRKTKHPDKCFLDIEDGWLYDYWSCYMNSKWLKETQGRWMPY